MLSSFRKTLAKKPDHTDIGLKQWLASFTPSTELNFEGWQLSDDGAKQLADFLEIHPEIVKVNLKGNKGISDTGGGFLLSAIKKQKLQVNIDLEGTRAVASPILLKYKQVINLTEMNNIDVSFIEALADCLSKNQTEHEDINLPKAYANFEQLQPDELSEIDKKSPGIIKHLTIIKQRLLDNKINKLLDILIKNDQQLKSGGQPEKKQVNVYDITKKLLDSKDKAKYLEALCKALTTDTHFTSITLHICKFEDEVAGAIANLLENNKAITSINLQGNDFTDVGIKKIFKAIQKNTTLKKIDISYNTKITPECKRDLNKQCKEKNIELIDTTLVYGAAKTKKEEAAATDVANSPARSRTAVGPVPVDKLKEAFGPKTPPPRPPRMGSFTTPSSPIYSAAENKPKSNSFTVGKPAEKEKVAVKEFTPKLT